MLEQLSEKTKTTLNKYGVNETTAANLDKCTITLTTRHFTKTSGKYILSNRTLEEVQTINYLYCVGAAWFFGGRVYKTFTPAGNIPYRLTSYSPDKTQKTEYFFDIRLA